MSGENGRYKGNYIYLFLDELERNKMSRKLISVVEALLPAE
jgi:hypothetical protein